MTDVSEICARANDFMRCMGSKCADQGGFNQFDPSGRSAQPCPCQTGRVHFLDTMPVYSEVCCDQDLIDEWMPPVLKDVCPGIATCGAPLWQPGSAVGNIPGVAAASHAAAAIALFVAFI